VINVVVSAPLPSAGSDAGRLTRQAQDWIEQQLERFATQG
jgi:hypothetical protein